jgi:hypothetical protein
MMKPVSVNAYKVGEILFSSKEAAEKYALEQVGGILCNVYSSQWAEIANSPASNLAEAEAILYVADLIRAKLEPQPITP